MATYTNGQVILQVEGCYGGIHLHDSSAGSQSIPTGTTYTKVTGFSDDSASKNCTPDSANNQITITVVGTYQVEGSFSFTEGTNNVNVYGTIFLDDVEQDQIHFQRKIGTGGDYGAAPISGSIVVATVPAVVDFRVRHDYASAVDFTATYANFSVHRSGLE